MHESRTYYNLMEANTLVPRLEHLFAQMAKVQGQVGILQGRADELGIKLDVELALAGEESSHPIKSALHKKLRLLSEEYSELIEKIRQTGVLVDDLDYGIVKFYSWVDGKEIFLSWQYGEPEVGHWHAVTENHIARRSLRHLMTHSPVEVPLH